MYDVLVCDCGSVKFPHITGCLAIRSPTCMQAKRACRASRSHRCITLQQHPYRPPLPPLQSPPEGKTTVLKRSIILSLSLERSSSLSIFLGCATAAPDMEAQFLEWSSVYMLLVFVFLFFSSFFGGAESAGQRERKAPKKMKMLRFVSDALVSCSGFRFTLLSADAPGRRRRRRKSSARSCSFQERKNPALYLAR